MIIIINSNVEEGVIDWTFDDGGGGCCCRGGRYKDFGLMTHYYFYYYVNPHLINVFDN